MRTRVGVSIICHREGKVLLGRRKGSHGQGTWGFPGGHLEDGETVEECAARELLEETGVPISTLDLKKTFYTEDVFPERDTRYITLYLLVASPPDTEPRVMEPDKAVDWWWFDPSNLPTNLFLPVRNLLAAHGGRVPY